MCVCVVYDNSAPLSHPFFPSGLRRVAAFCRPLRRVLLLVSRWRIPVTGTLGLCWLVRGRVLVVAAHSPPHSGCPPPASPCFRGHVVRRVAIFSRGPGQSPVLPFAGCVASLCSHGRCGPCSCWCRFRVRGAQWLAHRGCAGGSFHGFFCSPPSALRPSMAIVILTAKHGLPRAGAPWTASLRLGQALCLCQGADPVFLGIPSSQQPLISPILRPESCALRLGTQ